MNSSETKRQVSRKKNVSRKTCDASLASPIHGRSLKDDSSCQEKELKARFQMQMRHDDARIFLKRKPGEVIVFATRVTTRESNAKFLNSGIVAGRHLPETFFRARICGSNI